MVLCFVESNVFIERLLNFKTLELVTRASYRPIRHSSSWHSSLSLFPFYLWLGDEADRPRLAVTNAAWANAAA